MSTSLLYHAFGVKGYKYLGTRYLHGSVVFEMCRLPKDWRCSACGSVQVSSRGNVGRLFQGLPIGGKKVWLWGEIPRLQCHSCEAIRQMHLGFAEPKARHTNAFARYALELTGHMTIRDVAEHLGVSWDTIKDIQKSDLQRRFRKPKLRRLKLLAIDEISIGHGQRYLTVVLDLLSGAICRMQQVARKVRTRA